MNNVHKLIYFISQTHIRSAIAEAWAKKLPLVNFTFISGSWRKTAVTSLAKKALHEYAMEPPTHISFVPNRELLINADLIVTIYDSEYEIAPNFPEDLQDKVIYWDIDDPERRQELLNKWVSYQEVCDDIALSVKNLEFDLMDA
ncbi:low molecular weight phosphatase family protein [Listeria grayi]|uniref:low molecular weight phosphatase family protein n=1 Tax=Listeria grayi TaxID=1641 RepID=UPI0016249246|nr:low molecular weight phosphatase family protein [Listeria grayi]MBC1921393.1 low molecular weight phosphatase family protein [Listeria grayi]